MIKFDCWNIENSSSDVVIKSSLRLSVTSCQCQRLVIHYCRPRQVSRWPGQWGRSGNWIGQGMSGNFAGGHGKCVSSELCDWTKRWRKWVGVAKDEPTKYYITVAVACEMGHWLWSGKVREFRLRDGVGTLPARVWTVLWRCLVAVYCSSHSQTLFCSFLWAQSSLAGLPCLGILCAWTTTQMPRASC